MYVDAFVDRKTDRIYIIERRDGQRISRKIPAEYAFYYEDPHGTHRSIFGHTCRKKSFRNGQQFRSELAAKRNAGLRIFESDINPVFRALAKEYRGIDAPKLHIGYFDIEAAFDKDKGFAPTNNPFNPITAITLYRSADNRLLTFALRPIAIDDATVQVVTSADVEVFDDEKALLLAFLDAAEDVDLLTGWNSSEYDIPYLVNRIKRVVGNKAANRLCLWDQAPASREYSNKFGRLVNSYDLIGRPHLDYLELYAKHNQQQRSSYKLDSIAQIEIGESKTPYSGTLDQLYNQDFPKFIEYNRQDVMLIVKIDRKLRFIELANQIAHTNCVLLKTTMGSVTLVEQAIINEVHAMRNAVVPDRKREVVETDDFDRFDEEDDDEDQAVTNEHSPVVGAYVAQPKKGLHDWIGCVDINSLYPSAIRALNMSPETLIGQVRLDETMQLVAERAEKLPKTHKPEAWDGIFETLEVGHMHAQDDASLTVDFFDLLSDGVTTACMTGKQLYDFIFDPANHLCITANGTIFRTDIEGMIPALLGKWYADRQDMQAKQKHYAGLAATANDPDRKEEYQSLAEHWDRCQYAAKIRLNSLYGVLLNEIFRMFDQRLGQSTTLTGRVIVRHMNAKINEIITGHYDYRGAAIQYSDTDSVAGESLIRSSLGLKSIEELFDLCKIKWTDGNKHYATDQIRVVGYSDEGAKLLPISYIYRHKVQKRRFKVTDSGGRSVIVTEDHSLMVERNGCLIEVKPTELANGDILITLNTVY